MHQFPEMFSWPVLLVAVLFGIVCRIAHKIYLYMEEHSMYQRKGDSWANVIKPNPKEIVEQQKKKTQESISDVS